MRGTTIAQAALVVLTGASILAASSCREMFNPCDDDRPPREFFLDGDWHLETVNGKSVPASGYVLPFGVGTLKSAELTFYTLYLDEGSCATPDHTHGDVVALYDFVDLLGGREPTQTQDGSFEYDNASRIVVLRALGHEKTAFATLSKNQFESQITVSAPIPNPLNKNDTTYYTLVFER